MPDSAYAVPRLFEDESRLPRPAGAILGLMSAKTRNRGQAWDRLLLAIFCVGLLALSPVNVGGMGASAVDEQGRDVYLTLGLDQALVLADWLARTSRSEQPAPFEDQAEQRALWDLEAALESQLPEVFAQDYKERLRYARSATRDSED